MMISDGFGPASETYARQYHAWREGFEPKEARLPLDHVHVGHSRTQSSSSLVTDSAAGATGKHVYIHKHTHVRMTKNGGCWCC